MDAEPLKGLKRGEEGDVKGIDVFERYQRERRERAQALKRKREEGDDGDEGAEAEGGAGPTTSAAGAKEVKESDFDFVPSGWFDCPRWGEPIGMFIPSKVPLSAAYSKRLPPDKKYTPQDAVEAQKALGREVGLVINLTKSNIYYHTKNFEELGVQVEQIKCAGRGEAPTPEEVNAFWYTVNR